MYTAQDIRNDLVVAELRQAYKGGKKMKRLVTVLIISAFLVAGFALVLAATISPVY